MTVVGLSKKLLNTQVRTRRGHRMCAIHILGCIHKVERVQKIDPHFKNSILYDAVVRNIQVLSESTRYIRKDIRFNHQTIPWQTIRKLRNELVHGYLTVNTDKALRVFIQHDLMQIKTILEHHYPDWKKEIRQQTALMLGTR